MKSEHGKHQLYELISDSQIISLVPGWEIMLSWNDLCITQ